MTFGSIAICVDGGNNSLLGRDRPRGWDPAGAAFMRDRLNQNDVTNRVNVEDPLRVRDAVLARFAARYPGADFTPLACAFDDFKALFEGNYPGYLACDTPYHDIRHTLDMSLAMARLIDGHDGSCAETERLFRRDSVRRFRAIERSALRKLDMLDAAPDIRTLSTLPGQVKDKPPMRGTLTLTLVG